VLQPTPARHIEPELYARILDQLSEMRWNGIVDFIFYNEPLLHPDIVLLVQQLKVIVPKCHPRIITNGDHLTVQLMSDLIAAGVERFSVSRHQPIKPGWDARVQDLARRHPGMLSVTDLMDVQEKQGLHTRAGLVPVGRVYVAARCNAPMNCQHIDIDGNLLLCCNDYYRKNVMGNVKESTILEVWRSERFTRIRSDLLRGKPSLAICKNCILRT
jgi:radical SAM protein with 4Fe4S-binding SPASM domain